MDVNGFYATLTRPSSVCVWWTDSDQSPPSTSASSSLFSLSELSESIKRTGIRAGNSGNSKSSARTAQWTDQPRETLLVICDFLLRFTH